MNIIKFPIFSKELQHLSYRVDGDKIYVKHYPQGVQAGFPSPAADFMEQSLSLDERYLAHPEATYLVAVKGNSMYPTLQMGDILIVKSNIEFSHDQIGIVSVNNTEFTVKRLDFKNKILKADNIDFPPIKIEETDTLLCLGVVKHLIRDL